MTEDFSLSMGAFGDVLWSELINHTEIQRLQDLFAEACGVASVITRPDGTPITHPSNFSDLCTKIGSSVKGREMCMRSSEKLGRPDQGEPVILPCVGCGLWHAGASISVGDQHVATWIIGQVRIKGQDEHHLANRAEDMGLSREEFIREIHQVPEISFEQFEKASKLLFAFAQQIADKANSNLQLKMEMAKRDKELLVLRTLVDNLPDSIYCKDLACRKTLVNQVELKYMKANSEAEVLGKDDFDFYPPEIAELFYADDQMVMQSGIPVLNREEYIIDENGQKRWLLTSKLPLRDKDNRIVGLIGIGRDITKRKLAETEIKLKNEQLILAHAEKDKFFSIIAHDLRNPFSSFLALTRIMDEQFTDLSMEEIHELTHSLKNSAANLYGLLENLLQWARMKQGLIPFNASLICLHTMVEESLAIIREPAKIKGVDLVNHIDQGTKVYSDVNSFQTVIRNLVSNAVKFTPKGGNISLSATAMEDNSVEIIIKDTGIGMSQSMIENLFRSDARVNRPGTEGEPSTGLGLLLCKEFIEKQGGTIWAVSEEGHGSEFHFTVPAASASEKEGFAGN